MKIKTPGKRPEEFFPFNLDGHCGVCGCTFRVEQGDTFDRTANGVQVDCPNESCATRVLIDDPSRVGDPYGR